MYPVELHRMAVDLYYEDGQSRPAISAFLEEELGAHAPPRELVRRWVREDHRYVRPSSR